MNLQLAQASKTRLKETNAVFHLNLSNNETGKTDELLLEFTHKELLDFYNKVIDSLLKLKTNAWLNFPLLT